MSDYLGLNQSRVLDSKNRSFESVVYQWKKPPLSCEVNLTGNLAATEQQNIMGFAAASGWERVGTIKDGATENLCYTGDVVTSSTYAANSLKLIALEQGVDISGLVAWVNGWKVIVQGSNTSDENNIITLPAPPTMGYRVDFVFLEVWKKLVTPEDVIYKYGNVLYGGTNYCNDLIDPAINIETTLRTQIQYRIRVSLTDIQSYPDGFDPNNVFVQGPLPFPISTCTHAYFSPVPGKPGLWRAGAGDSAAQEDLQTVDGYTYAIPMFAIHRRNTHTYDTESYANGNSKTLANYLLGYPSDRPDNKYNNWVAVDDILDMRHKISTSENVRDICNDAFYKLYTGKLRGKLQPSLVGEDHLGVILTQVDSVSNYSDKGALRLTSGDGHKRVFSNAPVTQPNTLTVRTTADKYVGTPSTVWANGDQVSILLSVGSMYPTGTYIATVVSAYTINGTLTGGVDYSVAYPNPYNALITVEPGSSLIGTSLDITADYIIVYPQGPNGLSHLPENFLEFRKEDSTVSIASTDMDIKARQSSPIYNSDGTSFIMLSNHGADTAVNYDFGHQMIYHTTSIGSSVITFPRNIDGYEIIGVISVKYDNVYRSWSTVTRDTMSYVIDLGAIVPDFGKDIEVVLYTKAKFFKTNNQTRAIMDTYEMSEIVAEETPDGMNTTFHFNTINRAILGIGSSRDSSGYGFAFANFGSGYVQTNLDTNNTLFPLDETKSRGIVVFPTAPTTGSVFVPTLMNSAVGNIDSTIAYEGYNFYYSTVPYQGLLDSSTTGAIVTEGAAITTSSGSGAIASTLNLKNIVDRLPAYDSDNDAEANNTNISTLLSEQNAVLETRIVSRAQDISGLEPNTVIIGVNSADRGRREVYIPGATQGIGNLGLRFEKLDVISTYQKTYQSYLLNKDNSGELYLMVVGSETANSSDYRLFSEASDLDVVDIFRLPGRPLTVRK